MRADEVWKKDVSSGMSAGVQFQATNVPNPAKQAMVFPTVKAYNPFPLASHAISPWLPQKSIGEAKVATTADDIKDKPKNEL